MIPLRPHLRGGIFFKIFIRMTMQYRLLLLFIFSLFSVYPGGASVAVPSLLVQNYTVDDYKASCQNWDLAVSYDGILYVANNSGLLTFDGNTWCTYALPDKSALHRVTYRNDTVYTAGQSSQGFWLEDAFGHMQYHPLDNLPRDITFEKPAHSYPLPSEIQENRPTAFATAGSFHFTGTASEGLYITASDGKILRHLSTENQLQDNIVRAICVQDASLIWVALDNGLSQIDIGPALTLMGRRSVIGKLQDGLLKGDSLYIRTNLGYFRRTLSPDDSFQAVDNRQGEKLFAAPDASEPLSVPQLFENTASLDIFAGADGVYPGPDNLYWLTTGNEAGLFHRENGMGILKCRILFDNYQMNLVTSDPRLISLNDSLNLVSTMQGTLLVNTRRLIAGGLGGLTMPRFRHIEYAGPEKTHFLPTDTGQISLPYDFRAFTLFVGTTVFTPNHQISYKLEGVSSHWSAWQKDGKISFLQLPEGTYELRIRKYVAKGPFPELSLRIRVRPPWYNTVWAYLGYILAAWVIGRWALRFHLRTMHREEQQRLEAERQAEEQRMNRMKNELLEAELQNKNNELTLQTSALVKRNQAIQSFLDELERQKEMLSDRYPNKLYLKLRSLMEEALNDQADWLQFETYFNSAHQHFMERLRLQYADITAGDLRICCLLRMNLSTKEIASLLNVSVRAVELRRYRLRKRLALEGDTNLVDFLMKF